MLYDCIFKQVAILLGADPSKAASDLKESLLFEIKLANASLPREERRNASKLYNPMKLSEMSQISNIVDWKTYVNNVLTADLLQVILLIHTCYIFEYHLILF